MSTSMSKRSSTPLSCLCVVVLLVANHSVMAWEPHSSTNDWNVASGNATVAANYIDAGTGLTCENPPGADTLVRISNGGEMIINSDLSWGALWVGNSGDGTVRHESGTLVANKPTTDPGMDFNFAVGFNSGKRGCYYMSGGRVTSTGGNAKIACFGHALLDIAGGEFYATRYPTVGLKSGAAGHLVVHGTGLFNTTAATQTLIGEGGQGVISVYGGGKVQTGAMAFGKSASAFGMVNILTGGEFSPNSIIAGEGATKRINGLGGTVKPRMASGLVNGYLAGAQMSVGAGGLAFDTNGKAVTLGPTLGPTRLLTRNLAHRWSFNGDATDSVGNMDATLMGENKANITYDNGEICLSGLSNKSTKEYIALGAGCIPSGKDGITIEMWTTHESYIGWSRIFTCEGNDSRMFIAWARGNSQNQDFTHFTVAGTKKTDGGQYFCPWTTGVKYHVTFVFEKQASNWRVNICKRDALTGLPMGRYTTTAPLEWDPSALAQSYFNLGYSHQGDHSTHARFDEVRIWNIALTEDELVESTTRGPDADFTTAPCLRKTGAGTLTLASASTYDGETKVEAGTLALRAPLLPVHRWSFENNSLQDSIAGGTALLSGTNQASIAFTEDGKGIETPGGAHASACVELGNKMIPTNNVGFAIEIWATLREARNCSRIFTVATSPVNNQLLMSWCRDMNNNLDWAGVQFNGVDKLSWDRVSPYVIDQPYHIVAVADPPLDGGRWFLRFYKQNVMTGTLEKKYDHELPEGWTPECLFNTKFALAWSPFTGDNDAHARYDEVRVWNRPLTEAEVIASGNLGPDELPKFGFSDAPAGALPAATTLRVDAGATFLLGGASQTVSNLVCNGTLEGPGTLTVTGSIRPGGASSVGALAVKAGVKLVGTVELDLLANGTGDSVDFASGGTFDISDIHWTIADPTTVSASRFYTIANAAGATLTGEPDVSGLPSSIAIEERNGNLVLHRVTGATIIIR